MIISLESEPDKLRFFASRFNLQFFNYPGNMEEIANALFRSFHQKNITAMFRNLRFIYITTKDRNEAKAIGKTLVEEKLAACVNILDGMESIYRWKDTVESDIECILIAKTTYSNVGRLTQRVKELHSYEVPCVVSLNLAEQEGNEEYLDWITGSVLPPVAVSETNPSPD